MDDLEDLDVPFVVRAPAREGEGSVGLRQQVFCEQ